MFSKEIPVDFLHDESRLTGSAEAIAFPHTTKEVQSAVREAAGRPITVQGARTGISGGAVPDGGVIISLARMTKILSPVQLHSNGRPTITVQSGVLLSELREFLKNCHGSSEDSPSPNLPHPSSFIPHPSSLQSLPPLFFPPDPTESSASIGGMTACNASGACSFAYGATNRHINGITVVLADGDTFTLKRGENHARGRNFSITTNQGRTISGVLPSYSIPDVKNAAGYAVTPDMDLLDLFIGSEGTLGIITEIELLLSPAPEAITGIICFFDTEAKALDFVEMIREKHFSVNARLNAIEYFDKGALRLIQNSAPKTGLLLPKTKKHWKNALYVEWSHEKECDHQHLTLTSAAFTECGGAPDGTWLTTDAPGMERMKAFRHAVPEQVNSIIAARTREHPELTKLGTDLSVPDNRLKDVMNLYRQYLRSASLEHVIFGHIGNNHVHVNIIPRNMKEYGVGKDLYRKWAAQVTKWDGSVSAEHGIGRLKKEMLALMYGSEHIDEMKALKSLFDPDFTLNPGRLF